MKKGVISVRNAPLSKYQIRVKNDLGKGEFSMEFFYVEDLTSDGRFSNQLSHIPLKVLLEDTFSSDAEVIT